MRVWLANWGKPTEAITITPPGLGSAWSCHGDGSASDQLGVYASARGNIETIMFLLMSMPGQPTILGFLWLHLPNPVIDWTTCSIKGWTPASQRIWLRPTTKSTPPVPVPAPDLTGIHHDLKELFNKARATSLPPHRPIQLRHRPAAWHLTHQGMPVLPFCP